MSRSINTEGLAAHPAAAAADMPVVRGYCPSCGACSLFLAVDGFVTCAIVECPSPMAAADKLDAFRQAFYGRLHAEGPVPDDVEPIDPSWRPIDPGGPRHA